MKLKHFEIASFLAFTAVILISLVTFEDSCQSIRDGCFRLHIIANSDSAEDQTLKLQVRDSLLENTASIFEDAENKDEAKMLAEKNIKTIEEVSKNVIKENGYDYSVQVEIKETYFPTRTYEKYTLPAGKYDAVRVIIGKGEGKNWWCVMFPSLCLPASVKKTNLNDVLTSDDIALMEKNPKYEIRFWIIEKIEEIKNKNNKSET